MNKYLDDFITDQQMRGRTVSPELLQVNLKLKQKDEAKYRWEHRDFWCRIGLHSRRQAWTGGGYPLTCVKCLRHLL